MVDKEFKVRRVEGLRVVGHDVALLMTNNHTQSNCYLIVSHVRVGELTLIKNLREKLLLRRSLWNIACNLNITFPPM